MYRPFIWILRRAGFLVVPPHDRQYVENVLDTLWSFNAPKSRIAVTRIRGYLGLP